MDNKDERGQNLIEFVLVLPIFLLILMGMIDFGWYLKLNHDLTRANAQGVRAAAFSSSDTTIKQAVVDSATSYLEIGIDNVSIKREDPDMRRGSWVEVSSNATYNSVTGFSPVHFILTGTDLNASATSRIE